MIKVKFYYMTLEKNISHETTETLTMSKEKYRTIESEETVYYINDTLENIEILKGNIMISPFYRCEIQK